MREKRDGEQRREERRPRWWTVCERMELVISVSWGEVRVESAAIMIVSSIVGSDRVPGLSLERGKFEEWMAFYVRFTDQLAIIYCSNDNCLPCIEEEEKLNQLIRSGEPLVSTPNSSRLNFLDDWRVSYF